MSDFRKLLDQIVDTVGGTKRDLAKAIGITPFAFSRLNVGAASPEICLQIAKTTNTNPSTLLRAAGRGDFADLVEGMYGLPSRRSDFHVAVSERVVILALRRLPTKYRHHFQLLIEVAGSQAVANSKAATKPKSRRRRRVGKSVAA